MAILVVYVVSHMCQTGGNCVEVGLTPDGDVSVRDSKDRNKKSLVYNPQEWDAFISGAKAGVFDRSALPVPVYVQ